MEYLKIENGIHRRKKIVFGLSLIWVRDRRGARVGDAIERPVRRPAHAWRSRSARPVELEAPVAGRIEARAVATRAVALLSACVWQAIGGSCRYYMRGDRGSSGSQQGRLDGNSGDRLSTSVM
jgi:hypothetical protein